MVDDFMGNSPVKVRYANTRKVSQEVELHFDPRDSLLIPHMAREFREVCVMSGIKYSYQFSIQKISKYIQHIRIQLHIPEPRANLSTSTLIELITNQHGP